jgi:hypothetical protein
MYEPRKSFCLSTGAFTDLTLPWGSAVIVSEAYNNRGGNLSLVRQDGASNRVMGLWVAKFRPDIGVRMLWEDET